jgi:hypothetical protein
MKLIGYVITIKSAPDICSYMVYDKLYRLADIQPAFVREIGRVKLMKPPGPPGIQNYVIINPASASSHLDGGRWVPIYTNLES